MLLPHVRSTTHCLSSAGLNALCTSLGYAYLCAGDGTQQILQDDPNILVISLHRFTRDFFPGTGQVSRLRLLSPYAVP